MRGETESQGVRLSSAQKRILGYISAETTLSDGVRLSLIHISNIGRIPGVLISTLGADKLIEGDYGQSAILFGIAAVIGILAIWQHDRILHVAAKLRLSKKKGTDQEK